MNQTTLPFSPKREIPQKNKQFSSPPIPLRLITWVAVNVWRACADWQTRRPLLTRTTAHISIIGVALLTLVLGGARLVSPQSVHGEANSAALSRDFTPLVAEDVSSSTFYANNDGDLGLDTLNRLPVLHTLLPERERADVLTYVIQSGDTIFGLAAEFGISPETIVWSNREAINDAPWLIRPGIELFILPVDGVYHTVRAGESVADIASQYEVEPEAIYNEWNSLEEGDPLQEGRLVVVAGGVGEEVAWEAPPPPPNAPGPSWYSYGVCNGVEVTGPGANGWFILPTGNARVSGWYFHDPRNPTHIGLDYACHLGDPIYAADSGVVTIAGWNGGYGIMIEVDHGNGFRTRYAHFDSLALGCGEVYQGQLLGYCGSTGWSTGPHLHFEIRLNGVPQDPIGYQ